MPSRFVVAGAKVVCTQMYNDESQSEMKKGDSSNGILVNGAYELVHTDIEFEPKFEKCRYCGPGSEPIEGEGYQECEPDIEGEAWQNYNTRHASNGGSGILEQESFMVCKKGYGLLYITECGQRPHDAKRLSAQAFIKHGDRSLLGLFMQAAFGGDPVNMATGNFIFMRTDIEIGGSVPMNFQRFYNTIDDYVGPLGKGWYHPYDISLALVKEEVSIRFEDGHEEVYQTDVNQPIVPKTERPKGYFFEQYMKVETEPNDSGYEAPDGNGNQLLKLKEGHRLVKSDGTTLYFDEVGKLTKIHDQNQVETTLTYEGDKLIKVNGLSGSLSFVYEEDRIVKLTDHTGRTVTYTYNDVLLTSATDPLGNVRTYAYDEKGRFLNEINPEGHLVVENEYDEKDRTIKQRYADGSSMGYAYEDKEPKNTLEKFKTEFIAQNGEKTIYYRDLSYRTTEIEYPDYGEIQTEYNWKNQKVSETDKIGPRTYYDYDEKGNLSRIENPLGEMTDLSYDEQNQLTSVSVEGIVKLRSEYDKAGNLVAAEDALKRQVRFAYDKEARGLPTHIAQPDGSVVKVKYDDRRNVRSLTDASSITTHYEYDSLNRAIKTIDGNGNETHFNYDLNNNVTRVINAHGDSQEFTYNKANKLTTITDFNGGQIQFDYNNLNKPSTITDQLGRTTQLSYDCMWNVNKVVQPNGAEIGFIYDENNRLVTLEKPDKNTIDYEYDKNGNKTKVIVKTVDVNEPKEPVLPKTDDEIQEYYDNFNLEEYEAEQERLAYEAVNETYFKYDKLQRLIEVSHQEGVQVAYTYNADGKVTSITDAMENVVYLNYDEAGQLIQETNVLGDCRTYTYTTLGKIATVTDEGDRTTTYEYEPGGRLKSIHHPTGVVETFTYDGNGNIITHTNQTDQKTTYRYDCLNRVMEIVNVNGSSKTYRYDPIGNVTSVTDELGHLTQYVYTLTGQLERVVDALGNETHYTYDALDQLIEVKQLGQVDGTNDVDVSLENFNGYDEVNRITSYKRDLLGQVTSVTDALGQTERYKYNPLGQLIEKLDKDGFKTGYAYTKQGDLSHIQYGDGKEVHLVYNSLRQLTEMTDWLGTTTIDLDALGRATKVTDHNANVLEYTYGKVGERRSIIYPDGKEVQYHYDELLRLTRLQDGAQFTSYSYDDYGRLSQKEYPNDTVTQYSFNELGQLQSLIHSQIGKDYLGHSTKETLDQFYYEYDLLGNKTEVNRIRQDVDGRNRLPDSGRYHYQYDALNRLSSVIHERDRLRTYQYDAFGNRVSKHEKGEMTTYAYNSLNQLIVSHDGQGADYEYVYDHRGNLTETYKDDVLTHRYQFGALNRLESAFNYEKSLGALYDYNGLGHRVGKQIGLPEESVTSEMFLDDINLVTQSHVRDVIDPTKPYLNLLQRIENGDSTFYTYDFGVLSSSNEQGSHQYLLDDLGSPIRMMNGCKHQSTLDYDEFGNVTHKKGHSPRNNPFSFTGYQFDIVSSSLFAQARQYAPTTGRFVSEDWIKGFVEFPVTLNTYIYCWNAPLDLVDLDGLMPSSIEAAEMADYIYGRESGSLSGGWILYYIYDNNGRHPAENLRTGNFPNLKIGVFRREVNGGVEYALVNRGSASGPNWIDNLQQPFGQSQDMIDSIRIAVEFVNNLDECEDVTMVGHSKGGAEAAVNAVATNTNAIIFNPAANNLAAYGLNANDFTGNMTAYIVRNELLHNVQGLFSVPIDNLVYLPSQHRLSWWQWGSLLIPKAGPWIFAGFNGYVMYQNHGMAAVLSALRGN